MRSKLKKAICVILALLSLFLFSANSAIWPTYYFFDNEINWQSEQLCLDLTNYTSTVERNGCSARDREGYFPFVLQFEGEDRIEGYAYHIEEQIILFYDLQSKIYDKSSAIVLDTEVFLYDIQVSDGSVETTRKLVVQVIEDNYFNKYADTFIELTPAK
ncbi:MAG: hypothetical protein IJW13_06470 [Clostridia bacterium]|nr:hypothetical protein [Clostridia bacterium]